LQEPQSRTIGIAAAVGNVLNKIHDEFVKEK